MPRELLFSVSVRDCRVDTFRSGGKGGQHQNKVESGVRVVHEPSGAVGESREYREQVRNKRAAFRRMAESPRFQRWVRARAAQLAGRPSVDAWVEDQLRAENLRIEARDPDGRWSTAAVRPGGDEDASPPMPPSGTFLSDTSARPGSA